MRRVFIFVVMCILVSVTVLAVEKEKEVDLTRRMPHNFLTPDYFNPNPTPAEALDETVNVRINSDYSGQIQNEQQLCINPTNSDNVVAVWRDFRLGYRRVGVGYSFDGGLTWVDDLFPVTGRPWHSDPGLTHDINGNFYAVVLAYEPDQSWSGFEVFKSNSGGVTWGPPTIAIDGVPNVFEDKELMACDRAPGSPYQGNLYIAWTRFYNTNIHVIRSTDGNNSWSSPVMISDHGSVQWPVPVVGADGVVYVAWGSYWYDEIKLDRSYDGGVTWGNDFTVSDVYSVSDYINGNILVFSFPAIDADITGGQFNGNLYVAYMDKTGIDYDIYFRKSTNQGAAWSSPVRINDDNFNNGRDQFHPWLVVDENGVITAMYYDRRLDPYNLRYDIYLTQSFDAGVTWTDNQRITTVSSDPTTMTTAGLIGEYSGLSVRNGVANLAWTDFRLGDQDTYGARVETYGTTDLTIDMIPESYPINVPAGGSFSFTGILTNNTNQPQTTDVWIMLRLPGGYIYGPIQQFYDVPLDPAQTISVPGIQQDIPVFAPLGTYDYKAYCGDYPSNIVDSTSFEFTVISPVGGGYDNWSLSDWFDDSIEGGLPEITLFDNYPDPFNTVTNISYALPKDGNVKLEVYNVLGQRIAALVDEYQTAGHKSINWDGRGYSSGLYFYKLTAGDRVFTKRMVLLK